VGGGSNKIKCIKTLGYMMFQEHIPFLVLGSLISPQNISVGCLFFLRENEGGGC